MKVGEEGKIIIRKSKKGKWIFEVDIDRKQPMKIPNFYDLKDDSLNSKKCEVEREQGQIIRILVAGEELPKKQRQKVEYPNKSNKANYSQNRQKPSVQNIYSIQKTKLPSDTNRILDGSDVENFGLKLNKCVNFIFDKDKEEAILYKSEYKDKNDNNKLKKLEIDFNFENLKKMIGELKNRQTKIKESLEQQNYKIKTVKLKPDWRLIVGLGNESVYETSMTLHHIYGIPYIPGSAVKGVTRGFIITDKFGEDENGNVDLKNAEERALQDRGFCDIFGDQKHKGEIIFFDAYPLTKPQIKVDVMNPHYSPYYSDSSGKTPPADHHNPNPIFFLTIADTEFEFMMGIKEKDNTPIQKGGSLLEVAHEYMKKALNEHGIGAKTAVGYGYMSA